MVGDIVKPMSSVSLGPVHLLRSELLGQKKCYVEYVTVDKAFCKSTKGSFGRNTACKEGKSVSRVRVYSSKKKKKKKVLPLHDGSCPV